MDIEKPFDSLNHSFFLAALKKFGFGTSFINWIEAILNKSESCVIGIILICLSVKLLVLEV